MKPSVLITGASSGIGLELAKCFARDGYDLVLVSRSKDKLQKLAQELQEAYQVSSLVIAQDLGDPQAPEQIVKQLKKKNITVGGLINNAGFGYFGYFAEENIQEIEQMMAVNMATLTKLTHMLLPDMIRCRKGKILNVASTAAFQPGPLSALYFATKAYVLSFSQGIGNELQDKGITVTCLCPGPTDTGFQKRANRIKSKLFEKKAMTAADVAMLGYRGMMRGQPIVVATSLKGKLLIFLQRFCSRKYIVRATRKMLESISPSQKRKY